MLKSLVMLSAAGVKPLDEDGRPIPNVELVPIIIDPHKSNEDLKRTEQMLTEYCTIREKIYGREVNGDGFFGTKISTLRSIMGMTATTINDTFIFNMEAVGQTKFRQFISYDTMDEPKPGTHVAPICRLPVGKQDEHRFRGIAQHRIGGAQHD